MSRQQRTPKNTEQLHTSNKTPYALALLATTNAQVIHLRDGEVVLYRRSRSLLYQCRYKLADGTWYRQSTRKASIEHAVAVACNLYDEARFRQRLGLAHQTHSFAQIATDTLAELRVKITQVLEELPTATTWAVLKSTLCPTLRARDLKS